MPKISQLPAGTAPNGTELGAFVQNGTTVKLSIDQITGSGDQLTPYDYGATGTGTLVAITQTDINNNPQWIGTYGVGTSWDTVGIQECIYACFAKNSTPGNVKWNSLSGGAGLHANLKFYNPPGSFIVNSQIYMVATGFSFEFSGRGSAQWSWSGSFAFTGNTSTSTTINNIPAATLALIHPLTATQSPTYLQGQGVLPGTYVTAINTSTSSITISQATTSSLTGANLFAFQAMFYCNSASYGEFRNVTLGCNTVMPRVGADDFAEIATVQSVEYLASFTALWVLAHDGNASGLSTQQLTIYDMRLSGAFRADIGLSISPNAGGQADTITIINPFCSDFNKAAIQQASANAVSNTIIRGDFQQNYLWGVSSLSGSMAIYATTMENQNNSELTFSPQVGAISGFGADMYFGAGTGLANPIDIQGVRSEASVIASVTPNALTAVARNIGTESADQTDWFSDYPFQLGTVILPTSNNTQRRTFICVDTGGNNDWNLMTPNSTPSATVTDPLASYTTNEWAEYEFFYRFGSSGFTSHNGIASNTATTITMAAGTFAPDAGTLYSIGGFSAVSEPTWDNISNGGIQPLINYAGGFNTTAGSTSASVGIGPVLSNGMYVVIPNADQVGEPPWVSPTNIAPVTAPLIAKISNVTPAGGGYTFTLSKPAAFTTTNSAGFYGTGTQDGNLFWLQCDFNAVIGLSYIDVANIAGGKSYQCIKFNDVVAGVPAFYRGDIVSSQSGTALVSGQQYNPQTNTLSATTGTVDVTTAWQAGNYTPLTPTGNMTLNSVTAPVAAVAQLWVLQITTSGTNSYTLTFGTNFNSNGTLATGVVSGAKLTIAFLSDGTKWNEIYRSPVSNTFSNIVTTTITVSATATVGDLIAATATISGGTLNAVAIGSATASSGVFTTVTATSASLGALNATSGVFSATVSATAASLGSITGSSAAVSGTLTAESATTTATASVATAAIAMGSGATGIYFGTGAPSGVLSAPQGSLYLRTDSTGITSRAYVNISGSTTWASLTASA